MPMRAIILLSFLALLSACGRAGFDITEKLATVSYRGHRYIISSHHIGYGYTDWDSPRRSMKHFNKSYSIIVVKQDSSGATVSEKEFDLGMPLASNGTNLPSFMGTTPRYAFWLTRNSYHVVELDTLKISHVPCEPRFLIITDNIKVVDENTIRLSARDCAFEFSLNGAREIHVEPEKVIYH